MTIIPKITLTKPPALPLFDDLPRGPRKRTPATLNMYGSRRKTVMHTLRTPLVTIACLLVTMALPLSAAEQAATPKPLEPPQFLRLQQDETDEPIALETAIVRYGYNHNTADQITHVDLVAAVHIGEKEYFSTLNQLFRTYDVVLYELVAPPNARVPQAGGRPSGAIGTAQQGLKNLLGLQFQLDQIDYTAQNFVHADLSPQEFNKAMQRRGESWWTMFSKIMQESMARANENPKKKSPDPSFGDLFGIIFGSNRELRMKRLLADQFSDMEVLTSAFGGEEGSSLITDRNTAALSVLKQQLQKRSQSIAIFYGAAHMHDFDTRLRKNFQLQPTETVWLEAWNLREPAE